LIGIGLKQKGSTKIRAAPKSVFYTIENEGNYFDNLLKRQEVGDLGTLLTLTFSAFFDANISRYSLLKTSA
jgi:hypothetical protein